MDILTAAGAELEEPKVNVSTSILLMQISLKLEESPKSQKTSRVGSDCSVDRAEFRNWKVNAEPVAKIWWSSAPNPLLKLSHGQVPFECLQGERP